MIRRYDKYLRNRAQGLSPHAFLARHSEIIMPWIAGCGLGAATSFWLSGDSQLVQAVSGTIVVISLFGLAISTGRFVHHYRQAVRPR